ncbi:hypothetical protein HG537_0B05370 [Torulaspora globosa]|uniref:Peroxisomal membrane protein PEX13 n=1 Tax=Torulaspora globosa TaxID=48254 RepID=A0A7H9HPC8_9SACH|nr:hypothetical protein HG537_0B05370 [Torulaspora sp. CBS 2947]
MSTSTKQRPKPWESSGPLDEQVGSTDGGSMTKAATGSKVDSSPDAPPRPAGMNPESLSEPMSAYRNSQYGGYGSGMYGNSMLGSGLYGGNSMFGGGYGSMYGGGYGSMYGGSAYGSLYGNGYGGGYMGGMNGGPGGLGESTQATFQLIESLIGAVAGFAQMLESTYMATHNSFFSMISVAEQFSYMKEMLGSFFGIFAMIKVLRRGLFYLTRGRIGSPPRVNSDKDGNGKENEMVKEFKEFNNGHNEQRKRKRISWKPLIFFLAAVFGFPYLLNKFIARMQNMQNNRIGAHTNQQIDPSKLEFARALYDFTPENPQIEVNLKKGDLMAIITKQDPMGRDSDWWKVRTRSGEVGYVPYNYVEIIKRQNKIERIQERADGDQLE